MAGRLGVLITQRLLETGTIRVSDGLVTLANPMVLRAMTCPVPTGRPIAKLCLDWTERKNHLSGPMAQALMHHFFDQGWLERQTGTRALRVTDTGFAALHRHLGLTRAQIDG